MLARGEREAARRDVGRMRLVRSLEGLQTASRKVISLSKHHESQTARTTSRDTSTAIRCDGAAIAGPPAPRHRPLAPIAHNDRYLSLTLSHPAGVGARRLDEARQLRHILRSAAPKAENAHGHTFLWTRQCFFWHLAEQ